MLIGLPPKDLLEDIAHAVMTLGKDPESFYRKSVSVTKEWVYDPEPTRLRDRIKPRIVSEKSVPLRHRTLAEVLNPMPDASAVIGKLLDYIARVDLASQTGAPRPEFRTIDGETIFPEDPNEEWWLTSLQRKAPEEKETAADEDGPPSELDENEPMEVDDSDCLSDADDRPAASSSYEPNLAWATES